MVPKKCMQFWSKLKRNSYFNQCQKDIIEPNKTATIINNYHTCLIWTTKHVPQHRGLAEPCWALAFVWISFGKWAAVRGSRWALLLSPARAGLLCLVEILNPQQAALISPMDITLKCKLLSSADSLWSRKVQSHEQASEIIFSWCNLDVVIVTRKWGEALLSFLRFSSFSVYQHPAWFERNPL